MKQWLADTVRLITEFVLRLLYFFLYWHRPRRVTHVHDPVLLLSASKLAQKIRNGELMSHDVIEAYIARIREVEPVLNAITERLFEEALKEAERADALIKVTRNDSGEEGIGKLAVEKPFLGVPLTVKDLFGMRGQLVTLGIYCRRNTRVEKDAEIVAALKKAGFIVLCRTTMPETGLWTETHSCQFGRTSNPYDTWRTSGGSSGGDAALAGAGASVIGLGSDIACSIRNPAAFCGLFGHKHTRQLVHIHEADGSYPQAYTKSKKTMRGYGPLARYSEDLWPFLDIIASPEQKKRLVFPSPSSVDIKKIKIFTIKSLDEKGIGDDSYVCSIDPPVKRAFQKTIKALRGLGAQVEPLPLEEITGTDAKGNPLPLRNLLKMYFSSLNSVVREDEDLVRSLRLPAFPTLKDSVFADQPKANPSILWEIIKRVVWPWHNYKVKLFVYMNLWGGKRLSNRDVNAMRMKQIVELEDRFKEFFAKHSNQAVLLLPVWPISAPLHRGTYTTPFNFIYCGLFNMLGFPATACPTGFDLEGYDERDILPEKDPTAESAEHALKHDPRSLHAGGSSVECAAAERLVLPYSVQIVGAPYCDCLTIAVAQELEKALGGWKSP